MCLYLESGCFLHWLTQSHEATLWPGYSTADEYNAMLIADIDNPGILDCGTGIAVPSWHLFVFKDASWPRTHADGTTMPIVFMNTVGCLGTTEIMPLHNAGKATTLTRTRNVQRFTRVE